APARPRRRAPARVPAGTGRRDRYRKSAERRHLRTRRGLLERELPDPADERGEDAGLELGTGEIGDLLQDREQRVRAPPRGLAFELRSGHVEVQLRDAQAEEIEAVLDPLVSGRESGRFLTAPTARHRGPPTRLAPAPRPPRPPPPPGFPGPGAPPEAAAPHLRRRRPAAGRPWRARFPEGDSEPPGGVREERRGGARARRRRLRDERMRAM